MTIRTYPPCPAKHGKVLGQRSRAQAPGSGLRVLEVGGVRGRDLRR